MKKNDIVTIIAPMGEFVGKIEEIDEKGILLSDPRLVVSGEQGLGFAHGIAQTGEMQPKEVLFQQYAFVTPTNKEVEAAWRQHTSGIAT